MTHARAPLPPVPTGAGTWSVWLAVGSILVVIVLQTVWGLFILMPQWTLVAGEADPNYIVQHNVGTALFSGVGIVMALAAIVLGARSVGDAKSVAREYPGRRAARVRGGIGISLGTLVVLYSFMMLSFIF